MKKARDNGDVARIKYDKLVIEGNPVSPMDRSPITPCDFYADTYSPHGKHLLSQPVHYDIKGNHFVAYAAKVTSLEEVTQAQKHLWLVPHAKSADHIMWAYKLSGVGEDDTLTAYDCNGEFGAQGPLVSSLHDSCNILVGVLRWSGQKIGPKRFEVIRSIASTAVNSLADHYEENK